MKSSILKKKLARVRANLAAKGVAAVGDGNYTIARVFGQLRLVPESYEERFLGPLFFNVDDEAALAAAVADPGAALWQQAEAEASVIGDSADRTTAGGGFSTHTRCVANWAYGPVFTSRSAALRALGADARCNNCGGAAIRAE